MNLREVSNAAFRRHPWEVARARFFLRVLRASGVLELKNSLLDVGAGDGWFSEKVLEHNASGTNITLWDSGYSDVLGGNNSDLRVRRTAEQPDHRYNTVLLMDVLEQVENDREFFGRRMCDLEVWFW